MQTVKPAAKQLFCRPNEAEEITKSGFYLQKGSLEKPQTAEVINVGSDVKGFKQKDTIVYKPYATTDLKVDGKQYFLIAEEDVLGTMVETSENK